MRRYPKRFRSFRRPIRRSFSQTDIQEEIEKETKRTAEKESQKFIETQGYQSEGQLEEYLSKELEPELLEGFEEPELGQPLEQLETKQEFPESRVQTQRPEFESKISESRRPETTMIPPELIRETSESAKRLEGAEMLEAVERPERIERPERVEKPEKAGTQQSVQRAEKIERTGPFRSQKKQSRYEKSKTEKTIPSKRIIKEEEAFEEPQQPEMYRTRSGSLYTEKPLETKVFEAPQPSVQQVERQEMEEQKRVIEQTLLNQIEKILIIIRVFFLLYIFLLVLVLFLFTESLKERDFVYIGTFFIDFVKLFPVFLFITITFVLIAAYLQLSDYTTASVVLVIFSVVFITLSIVYLMIIITGLPLDVLKYITVVTLFVADIMGIVVIVSQFWYLKKKRALLMKGIQGNIQSTVSSIPPRATQSPVYSEEQIETAEMEEI
jgi:hypothetical protein